MSDEKRAPSFIEPEDSRIAWLKSLEQRDAKRYFRSGFAAQDQVVGAFERGTVNGVGAPTGVGKTSYLFSLSYRMASRHQTKIFYFNLEMPVAAMWNRLACIADSTLRLSDLRNADFTPAQVEYFVELSHRLVNFTPLFCEDSDIKTLIERCCAKIERGSDSVLIIDYFSLLSIRGTDADNRWATQAECAKQLKLFANHLDIPIIVAIQLNTSIEKNDGKGKNGVPTLGDFRGDKEILHHSNIVLALVRDNRDRLDAYCLKNRNGPTGMFSLEFIPERAAVEEWGD